ncbi:MAG: DNA-binding protein [Actinomycetota bacterium]|nr:DNA-binding protein [Actinomycetota bacterium]
MVVIEVRNAELMETMAEKAKHLDITNGAIVSVIGAVDSFTISTMPKHDATKDVITDYSLPAEMTGTGEIINGTVHIHAVLAVEGDQAVADHLHRAAIGTFFARA